MSLSVLIANNKATRRMEVNPMDITTIVSILPKKIKEVKPTIVPPVYEIEAGTYEKPALLSVAPASWWRELNENEPLLEVPQSSIVVARAVVIDYCNGMLACNMGNAMPGLFIINGNINRATLLREHKSKLDDAKEKQDRWFQALVKMGDTLWSRSQRNPNAISDDMRLAAEQLNMKEIKDWMQNFTIMDQKPCIACGTLRNPEYPVCPNCKNVDTTHPKAKDLKFAE